MKKATKIMKNVRGKKTANCAGKKMPFLFCFFLVYRKAAAKGKLSFLTRNQFADRWTDK